jgi:uncharacterized membrane protein
MNWLIKSGRFVFAIAIAAIGVQHWLFFIFHWGSKPGYPWPVARLFWEVMALALPILVLGLMVRQMAHLAAGALAAIFLVRFLVVYVPQIAMNLRDPGPWTSGFEIAAMCGAFLVLTGTLSADRQRPVGLVRFRDHLVVPGRLLFASSLVVVAIQHFMYAHFVATLVPAWLPARLFWAYFVGGAFHGHCTEHHDQGPGTFGDNSAGNPVFPVCSNSSRAPSGRRPCTTVTSGSACWLRWPCAEAPGSLRDLWRMAGPDDNGPAQRDEFIGHGGFRLGYAGSSSLGDR